MICIIISCWKIERENVDLLFTDTDSLGYNIRNQDIFKIIKDNKELFDFSNYRKDSNMCDPINNKVISKFKHESIKPIREFVGLRAKLYTFQLDMLRQIINIWNHMIKLRKIHILFI
jgi:hypothetical protein